MKNPVDFYLENDFSCKSDEFRVTNIWQPNFCSPDMLPFLRKEFGCDFFYQKRIIDIFEW